MTTQELRDLFNNSGLSYNNITKVDIKRLRALVILELKVFRKENKAIRVKISSAGYWKFDGYGKLIYYSLLVETHAARLEGISLSKDESISIAGWANERSIEIQPFQRAFESWVKELSEKYAKSLRPLEDYPFSKASEIDLLFKKRTLIDQEKSIKREFQLIENELKYRSKLKD